MKTIRQQNLVGALFCAALFCVVAFTGNVYSKSDSDQVKLQSAAPDRDTAARAHAAKHQKTYMLAADTSGSSDGQDSASDGAAFMGDPAAIERGRQLYGNTCLFCHGAKGVGARAPTLVSGAWAPGRGNTAEYMFETVMEGRPGTIMGAFKEMLQPQEIWQIVAYLRDQAHSLAAKKK